MIEDARLATETDTGHSTYAEPRRLRGDGSPCS
jgi:hypothetical protein